MPIDLAAIKARLQQLDKKNEKSSKTKQFIWKPEKDKGKYVVRIVPYQHQPENPFVELKFHYGLNNKTFLSPATFNQPDPVVELSDHLKKSGDKDQWRLGRNLEPKLRTYVPVIVRGEEDKGVRFWGFGQTVYKQLLGFMSEPDYGDITDVSNGFDMVVECKSVAGKQYPDTSILPKPRPCPVIDTKLPNAKSLVENILKKQPNLLEVYEVATYDDLKNNLEEYLKKREDGTDGSTETETTDSTDETAVEATPEIESTSVEAQVEEPAPTVSTPSQTKSPVTTPKSPTAVAAAKASVTEFNSAFDKLFNS